MNMKEAVSSVFSNYFNFSGRARRAEFWYFALFCFLAPIAVSTVLALFGGSEKAVSLVLEVFSLATFIPGLAVLWRRLHDINKSGACYFWILFPIAGAIMLLVWTCREGTRGPNRYGPDPKDPFAGRSERDPWKY